MFTKDRLKVILFSILYMILISPDIYAQTSIRDTANKDRITIIAGKKYDRSAFHQFFWGRHYRKEWATPVLVPLFYLDTAAGGLKPYEAGGGRQSKTLRLINVNEKEYVLRSIDKTFGKALPDIYKNTFIENVMND